MPSTTEGILLFIGAVFFLIGLLGGGFELSGAKMPTVGKWPRFFSGATGALLLIIALFRILAPPAPSQPVAVLVNTPAPTVATAMAAPTGTAAPPPAIPVAPTQPPATDPSPPLPPPTRTETPATNSTETQPAATLGWRKIADLPRQINALVVDPSNPRIVYAATGDSSGSGAGVFKSADSGRTWTVASNGLPSESVNALAINTADPPALFAQVGVRGKVYSSVDGAANWTLIGDTDLFGGYARIFRIDPRNPRIMFALSKSDALVRSIDGGETWQPIGAGLPSDEHHALAMSLAIDPFDSNIMYAGTGGFVGNGHGVYKSVDGGDTWEAVNRGMLDYRITAIATHPHQTQTIFAGSDNGDFFRSMDGGQTWEELSAALPVEMSDHPTITEIIILSETPETIYLLVDDAGVVISDDGGNRWRLLGQPGQFSFTSFTTMTVIPDTEPVLLIAIEREGAWRYAAS